MKHEDQEDTANDKLVAALRDIVRRTRPAPRFSQRTWEAQHNSAIEAIQWVQNKARAALEDANNIGE